MYHHAVFKKFGLFLVTFQNEKKKKRKEERKKITFYFYIIIYCVRSMSWFTFLCVCECVCVWFLPTFQYRTPKTKNKKRNLTIDFFSLYVLFSQIREFAFWFSLIMHIYVCGCTCTDDIWNKQFSGLPSRGLRWEKHTEHMNIQAKKVYSYVLPLILVK